MVWKPGVVFRGRIPDEAFEVDDVFKPFLPTAWPKIVHLTQLGLTPEAICDSLERDATETIVLDYVRAVRDRLATTDAPSDDAALRAWLRDYGPFRNRPDKRDTQQQWEHLRQKEAQAAFSKKRITRQMLRELDPWRCPRNKRRKTA